MKKHFQAELVESCRCLAAGTRDAEIEKARKLFGYNRALTSSRAWRNTWSG